MPRTLYLVRHGEQVDAEHGVPDGELSARGRRQASLIAQRLSGVPFDAAWHSPLKRAEETVRFMTSAMPSLDSQPSSLLLDCVPTEPLPQMPPSYEAFFGSFTEADFEAGRAQMRDAVEEYLGPRRTEHELIVTHNFVIAWFVREVMEAPPWRWIGLNVANCGLTVLQQRAGRPWTLVAFNDTAHLPIELRTGVSASLAY